ncbi:hypothetical protein AC579_508 [Pseudocercospora musae]|uniref:Uncharacterized protein n=1 Tax=Pseudocercospora musae TaxID=113226 RepID=A0A139I637_9PEZI|nr:hypothetical protein AC579_508 [Pseudocercospora musae]
MEGYPAMFLWLVQRTDTESSAQINRELWRHINNMKRFCLWRRQPEWSSHECCAEECNSA